MELGPHVYLRAAACRVGDIGLVSLLCTTKGIQTKSHLVKYNTAQAMYHM
jgi:hypothetical protein